MQSNAHFPPKYSPHALNWTRFAKMIGLETTGKMCIDFAQQLSPKWINEQNKSIATGPLYGHTEFDMI